MNSGLAARIAKFRVGWCDRRRDGAWPRDHWPTKSAHCRALPTGVSLRPNRNRPHREATARAPPDVRIAHCNGGTAMTVAPTLQKYLDQTVTYELISHDPTMSSTRTAEACHVPGDCLAKGVVLRHDGGYMLAILPASHHI